MRKNLPPKLLLESTCRRPDLNVVHPTTAQSGFELPESVQLNLDIRYGHLPNSLTQNSRTNPKELSARLNPQRETVSALRRKSSNGRHVQPSIDATRAQKVC